METTNEQLREAFSQRLRKEIERLGLPLSSPTHIANVFSARFPNMAVTPQTVRKWLLAEAIPTQHKVLALAEWFGISAQWLRYGTGARVVIEASTPSDVPAGSGLLVLGSESAELVPLIQMLTRLPAKDLLLIKGIVGLMLAEVHN